MITKSYRSKPKTILIATHCLPSKKNSSKGHFVAKAAQTYAAQGCEVVILYIGTEARGSIADLGCCHNLTLFFFPLNTHSLLLNVLLLPAFSLFLTITRSPSFDIVESHWVIPSILVTRLIKAKEHFLIWHGTDFRLLRLLFPVIAPLLSYGTHVTNSYWMSNHLQRYFRKVHVKRPQCNLNPQLPYSDNSPIINTNILPIRLLVVARLTKQKRISFLFKALKYLSPDLFRLTIVGEGPEYHRLSQQISASKQDSSVRFIGTIQPSNMSEVYLSHDCILLLSHSEGLGLVVTEALSYGLYAFIADDSGLTDHLQHPQVQIGSKTPYVFAQQLKTFAQSKHEERSYWKTFSDN